MNITFQAPTSTTDRLHALRSAIVRAKRTGDTDAADRLRTELRALKRAQQEG